MNQQIPIYNKEQARTLVLAVLFLVFVIGVVIYLQLRSTEVVYLFGSFIIIWILVSIIHLKKQNITQAIIHENSILVIHNNEKIDIPFAQIIEIKSGLNYFIDVYGKLSHTFTIYLNHKYKFGSRLFIKYKKNGNLNEEEPSEIKYIRNKLKQVD